MRTRSRHPSRDIATAVSVVLRGLAVCGQMALVDPATSAAQTAEVTADIPAQALARALDAFAGQTGLQLVYVSGVVRDQRSYAVSAPMSAPEALARLLQGTG